MRLTSALGMERVTAARHSRQTLSGSLERCARQVAFDLGVIRQHIRVRAEGRRRGAMKPLHLNQAHAAATGVLGQPFDVRR